ncbi:MAG: hypothetical protein M3Y27_15940, partial [Acidobacteriota bacterium]|nr:hypothetical protein [Acidobacteriota bacterium]
ALPHRRFTSGVEPDRSSVVGSAVINAYTNPYIALPPHKVKSAARAKPLFKPSLNFQNRRQYETYALSRGL